MNTLQEYIENRRKEYDLQCDEQPFEEEDLIWAIQEYESMKGSLSQQDYDFLYLKYDFTEYFVNDIIHNEN